jgi:hypothetical protein
VPLEPLELLAPPAPLVLEALLDAWTPELVVVVALDAPAWPPPAPEVPFGPALELQPRPMHKAP